MDISPANELDNVNNNIESTTTENTQIIKSSGGNIQSISENNESSEDVKASNEYGEYTEIHSSDLAKEDDGGKKEMKRLYTIFGIILLIILFIIIPIYVMFRYELYSEALPYVKTNIFFIIRRWWFFVIIGCIYLPIRLFKYLKILFIEILNTISYIHDPLKDESTRKRYNSFKYKKVKLFYKRFARVWFVIKLIFMLIWFLIILLIMLLSSYMVGHLIGWMDYFWILR